MPHIPGTIPEEKRRRLFDAFYHLTARQIMDSSLERSVFIPPHIPVLQTLELFTRVDHAWVREHEDSGRRIRSILLRRDVFRALAPPHVSYTRFLRLRFHSLPHGAADCICCFTEGRVLHVVGPDTPCSEVLHLMETKGVLYLPVMEGGEIVGEIGSLQVVRVLCRLQQETGATP